jgi:hypothetical protein
VGNLRQKAGMLAKVLGILPVPDGYGFQFTILLVISVVMILRARSNAVEFRALGGLAGLFMIVSLLPTPTYFQYFCVAVPFLIPVAATALARLIDDSALRKWALVVLAGYVALAVPDVYRYVVTGDGVIGIRERANAPDWKIETVRDVSSEIDNVTSQGETVMALWSGYLYESHAVSMPGLENPFAVGVAPRVDESQLETLRLISPSQIQERIAAGGPRLVVVGNHVGANLDRAEVIGWLEQSGYQKIRTMGRTTLFQR